MKHLQYNPMILLRIHGNIIIQEAAKIFGLFNPVRHYHLRHGLPEILSWIVRALFHGNHHNEFSSSSCLKLMMITCSLLSFLTIYMSWGLLPLSNHLVQSLLNHGMWQAWYGRVPIRAWALYLLWIRWRHAKPAAATQSPACSLLKLDLLLALLLPGTGGGFHSWTWIKLELWRKILCQN